jgi:hypothetical protein
VGVLGIFRPSGAEKNHILKKKRHVMKENLAFMLAPEGRNITNKR